MRKRLSQSANSGPRSAGASAQSVQGLCCPLKESLDTTECINGEQWWLQRTSKHYLRHSYFIGQSWLGSVSYHGGQLLLISVSAVFANNVKVILLAETCTYPFSCKQETGIKCCRGN